MRSSGPLPIALGLVLALGGTAAPTTGALLAQSPAAELDRIQAVADQGRIEEAREALARWRADHEARADRRALQRARLLRARLTADADSARAEYLWVAIEGSGDGGAEAWLRLGQLDLTAGDPDRALQDLARLRDEYPGSPLVPASWWWAGLAHEAAGRLEEACRAWQRAAREADRRDDPRTAARAREAAGRCASGHLRLTVQLGAFRERAAAEALRERAAEAGYDARVERADGLHKVRVGRFGGAEPAREAAERLRRAGFTAVVLSEDA